MVDFISWTAIIKNCLQQVSDLDYQRSEWLNQDPSKIASFNEMICQLYDDFAFKDYIEFLSSKSLNVNLVGELRTLDSKIESFLKSPANEKNDIDIINDPVWIDIAHDAKEILLKFKDFWA